MRTAGLTQEATVIAIAKALAASHRALCAKARGGPSEQLAELFCAQRGAVENTAKRSGLEILRVVGNDDTPPRTRRVRKDVVAAPDPIDSPSGSFQSPDRLTRRY